MWVKNQEVEYMEKKVIEREIEERCAMKVQGQSKK